MHREWRLLYRKLQRIGRLRPRQHLYAKHPGVYREWRLLLKLLRPCNPALRHTDNLCGNAWRLHHGR